MFHGYQDPASSADPNPRAPLTLVMETFPSAATVEISFSGGNDEGGPDNMRVLDEQGRQIGTLSEYEEHPWEVFELDADGAPVIEKVETDLYPYEYEREKIAERNAGSRYAEAAANLTSPIDACYGSFAGSPYITGTLSWDLRAGDYKMEDQPSY